MGGYQKVQFRDILPGREIETYEFSEKEGPPDQQN